MARVAYQDTPGSTAHRSRDTVPAGSGARSEGGMGWTIEAVREADVASDAVWHLYAEPATWSQWGHNATWARADGPLVLGGTVDVRANYGTVYHCRIRRLEEGRALEI